MRNKLESGSERESRVMRNLHELNDYWIRHYFER
jgi:hypothetical protein